MILFLRVLFLVVLTSMLGVTTWASLRQPLGEFARGAVIRDPWVIATLFDAYWGFVAFFVWVAWKEQSLAARVLWFLSLIALGNLAIAAYMLAQLFRVSAAAPAALTTVFTVRQPGHLALPGTLTALSVVTYLIA
ncbi:MAG: hypothetical protein CK548_09380 [Opitutia bacterium]|nr:DUF1475 domain-containing protein [Opitutaceae bacterium]PHX70421.1 MAG: hypothetical protein CK548_09380 [Opitutae bacterium]